MSALTVRQLIKLLRTMPLDESVMLEGCDCWGEANGVELRKEKFGSKHVLITRDQ